MISFVVVFTITFYMYHLPLKAVLYPTLLCFVISIVCVLVDYSTIRKKHLFMSKIKTLTSTMIEDFGNYSTITDEDYKDIIHLLQKKITKSSITANNRYQDMMDYYSVWVHQIKTPIASMRLTLQNEDSFLSRKLQTDLFRIEQYVEMVLAYLRLNSITSDYVLKEHSIDVILKRTIKKFTHEFIVRKITLQYEPITKTIVTDDKWFSFVLEQILSNALKYTCEGSVKIYFTEQNVLCIEDTGIGISPQDLPRIFQKGYTGYNGRINERASGIGLYLCKRVCKNLGLGITVESVLKKGTIVKINLEQYQLKIE